MHIITSTADGLVCATYATHVLLQTFFLFHFRVMSNHHMITTALCRLVLPSRVFQMVVSPTYVPQKNNKVRRIYSTVAVVKKIAGDGWMDGLRREAANSI